MGCVLASCGASAANPSSTAPVVVHAGDVAVINRLLGVEYYAAAAYTAGVPLLSDHNLRLAKRFLNQELSHIAALTQLLKSVHAKQASPAPSYDLGHPRNATEVLELFHRVEELTIRAYLTEIEAVSPGGIQSTFASILANEAQHVSVIRRNLGQQPVPGPLLTAGE